MLTFHTLMSERHIHDLGISMLPLGTSTVVDYVANKLRSSVSPPGMASTCGVQRRCSPHSCNSCQLHHHPSRNYAACQTPLQREHSRRCCQGHDRVCRWPFPSDTGLFDVEVFLTPDVG